MNELQLSPNLLISKIKTKLSPRSFFHSTVCNISFVAVGWLNGKFSIRRKSALNINLWALKVCCLFLFACPNPPPFSPLSLFIYFSAKKSIGQKGKEGIYLRMGNKQLICPFLLLPQFLLTNYAVRMVLQGGNYCILS